MQLTVHVYIDLKFNHLSQFVHDEEANSFEIYWTVKLFLFVFLFLQVFKKFDDHPTGSIKTRASPTTRKYEKQKRGGIGLIEICLKW